MSQIIACIPPVKYQYTVINVTVSIYISYFLLFISTLWLLQHFITQLNMKVKQTFKLPGLIARLWNTFHHLCGLKEQYSVFHKNRFYNWNQVWSICLNWLVMSRNGHCCNWWCMLLHDIKKGNHINHRILWNSRVLCLLNISVAL